jgi:hypothetical protein
MNPNRPTNQLIEKIAIFSFATLVGLGLATSFIRLNTQARVAVENALSGHAVAVGCVQPARSLATRRLQ